MYRLFTETFFWEKHQIINWPKINDQKDATQEMWHMVDLCDRQMKDRDD